MKRFIKFALLILVLGYGFFASAQEENISVLNHSRLWYSHHDNEGICHDSVIAGRLSLNVFSNNYIKNNEYFGSFTEGITYFGSVFQPELKYDLTNQISLSAGWHFNYFFGQEKFNRSLPVIRVVYQPAPKIKILIGQLYGNVDHCLIEPIYSNDNYYAKKPEYGIQLRTGGRIKTDTWIDWEKFILPGDPEQEQIGGGTHIFSNFKLSNTLHLSVHLQAVIHHFGGQVDASDNYLQTRANLAPGLELHFHAETSDLNIIGKAYVVQALDLSQTPQLPYLKGYGTYFTLTGLYKGFFAMAGYWNSEYYFAPMASTLFQSISDLNNWYYEDNRQLFLGKFGYNKSLTSNIKMGIRFETYYDLVKRRNDFSYGMNIQLNPEIFLKNIKQ
jgi:hypothetical protein